MSKILSLSLPEGSVFEVNHRYASNRQHSGGGEIIRINGNKTDHFRRIEGFFVVQAGGWMWSIPRSSLKGVMLQPASFGDRQFLVIALSMEDIEFGVVDSTLIRGLMDHKLELRKAGEEIAAFAGIPFNDKSR